MFVFHALREATEKSDSPYMGIALAGIIAIFIIGLAVIGIGEWKEWRERRRKK